MAMGDGEPLDQVIALILQGDAIHSGISSVGRVNKNASTLVTTLFLIEFSPSLVPYVLLQPN